MTKTILPSCSYLCQENNLIYRMKIRYSGRHASQT
jgi:hypothetical protein